jgi:glycine cleavage system transcriptional repressor
MPHVAVTAVGVDRPGIVAAVTGVLLEHGGNLEDTAMTRLGTHFAMVLVVEVPAAEDAAALEVALETATAALDLDVSVRAIAEVDFTEETGSAWAVSVHGADQPGIVHRVASVLAEQQANIVDLTTRQLTTDAGTGYVMLLEVRLADGADETPLRGALDGLATELGVDISLRADEPDYL